MNLPHHNSHIVGHRKFFFVTMLIMINGTIYPFPDQGRKQPLCKLRNCPLASLWRTIGLNYPMFFCSVLFVVLFSQTIRVERPFREYPVKLLHVTDTDSGVQKEEGVFPRLYSRTDVVPGVSWILIHRHKGTGFSLHVYGF